MDKNKFRVVPSFWINGCESCTVFRATCGSRLCQHPNVGSKVIPKHEFPNWCPLEIPTE